MLPSLQSSDLKGIIALSGYLVLGNQDSSPNEIRSTSKTIIAASHLAPPSKENTEYHSSLFRSITTRSFLVVVPLMKNPFSVKIY
jgi:hypothetical protein